MNIFEKIVAARSDFIKMNVKMSGENKFAKYRYYELADITPAITALELKYKFICAVCFDDKATLTVIDCEKPEDKIVFTSPMATADLKGCHDVQNLGASETYLKRYLYQNAFEIVEADALNATHNPNEPVKTPPPKQQEPPKPKEPPFEIETALEYLSSKGLSQADISKLIGRNCGTITRYEALKITDKLKDGSVWAELDAMRAPPKKEEDV